MAGNLTIWLIIAIVPLCGIICALTPFFMPRSECFAVTVPESAQTDSRLKQAQKEGAKDSEGMTRDDDRYWKLGVFYVNADDPSIFVPKRFGFGWTCNFGRPATWAILIGFILFVVAFVAIILMLLK